jgi:hypothetical protein
MRRITPRRRALAPCEREKPWRRAARRSALAATAATTTLAGLLLAAAPAQAYYAGGNETRYSPAVVGDCRDPLDSSTSHNWLAFTGTDGQLNLLAYPYGLGYNGGDNVVAQYYLGYHAVGAPALDCRSNHLMVMAWRNSANQIEVAYVVASNGTIALSQPVIWSETTDASPSLGNADPGSFPDADLILGWAGTDGAHHINLVYVGPGLGEGQHYVTTDYTRAGAGVSVDGEPPFTPYFGNYIGFIASSGSPNIYIGFFTGGPQGNNLGSVRTTDTSPYAPSVYGQVVLWKGYTNNLIYEGSITLGSNNLHSSAPFSDTTLSAPSNSGCETAYEGTDYHIYYNNEPFFGCTVG